MQRMAEEEAKTLLQRAWIASLGLAAQGVAHVIPVTYGYDGETLYLQARGEVEPGVIEQTQEACLLVTEALSEEDWHTVTVHGTLHAVDQADEEAARETLGPLTSGPGPVEELGIWKLVPSSVEGLRSSHTPVTADDGMDIV